MFCLQVTFHSTVVKVITCGFPPLEDRDKSLKSLAQHDFFGGGTLTKEETVSLTRSDYRRNIIHGSEICSSSSKLCALIVLFLYTSIAQTFRVGKAISK